MKVRKWILIILIVISSFVGLVWYLGLYGAIIGLLGNALLIVLTNLDRVADIIASSYKLGRKVDFWFEKKAVEERLEVTLGSASKKVNQEVGIDLLPHGVDVTWVEPKDRGAFLQEGKIVVCLESSYNEERNLSRATMFYVREDLISESQRFINSTILKSSCFAIARKILMLDRKLRALRCLNEEFIEPEIKKMPQIREYVSGMDNMDKQGCLTRILLREFSQLDSKLSPALTDPQARKETKALTRQLKRFVERKGEEDLDFKGSVFRISLMPVAKLGVHFDIANFVKAASHCHFSNMDTIYVLARGMNVAIAKLVVSEIEKANLYSKSNEWEYKIVGIKKPQLSSYIAELLRV